MWPEYSHCKTSTLCRVSQVPRELQHQGCWHPTTSLHDAWLRLLMRMDAAGHHHGHVSCSAWAVHVADYDIHLPVHGKAAFSWRCSQDLA